MKFDGRAFARIIEEQVKNKVTNLVGNPRIVSFLVGNDPASELYTKLKKQAAERVGINFEIIKIDSDKLQVTSLSSLITEIGAREDVTGVMVQLPVPGLQESSLKEVLDAIPLHKDVDGLRYPESGVVPPVVTAVMKMLEEIAGNKSSEHLLRIGSELWGKVFAVVGARGTVGKGVVEQLEKKGVEVIRVGRERTAEKVQQAEVIISCVGKEGLITEAMVQEGAIVIDVGAPKGDMMREVYQKASISVEVPGGVGPVTIACLMEEAVNLCVKKNRSK